MNETHVVTRRFEGPSGREFQPGERVDASGWPHAIKLVEQRRLRPMSAREIRAAQEADKSGQKKR
jgi:hypothetical protein